MNEEEILSFVRLYIPSVYTLDVLLLFNRQRQRKWHADDVVRELRSSRTAVDEALKRLVQAGFVTASGDNRYVFAPMPTDRAGIVEQIDSFYSAKPLTVVNAIVLARDEKL